MLFAGWLCIHGSGEICFWLVSCPITLFIFAEMFLVMIKFELEDFFFNN